MEWIPVFAKPTNLLKAGRHIHFAFAVDFRFLLAAGPPIAIEAIQISIFEESRLWFYAAALVLSAVAGVAHQIGTENLTLRSCIAAFLQSGLFGLSITLVGMSFSWIAAQPGILLGFSIGIGLCGPAAIQRLQERFPDMMVAFLQTSAEWMAGKKSTGQTDREGNP